MMSRVKPPLFYWKQLFHSSRGQCISDLPPPAARSGLDQRGAVGLGGRKHPNAPCFRRRHDKERQWEADGRFCRSRSA